MVDNFLTPIFIRILRRFTILNAYTQMYIGAGACYSTQCHTHTYNVQMDVHVPTSQYMHMYMYMYMC